MRASEVAYQRLKNEIIQWDLEPGTALGEIETASRIGVSRTPIREALSRLAAEGLVAAGPGRTLRVAPLSLEHIRELYEVREALEVQTARLAARRRDVDVFLALREEFMRGPGEDQPVDAEKPYFLADRLDAVIEDAAGNAYLVNALRDLRGHLARVRRHAHHNPDRLRAATQEHLLIVEAIISHDEMLAARATAVHLHNSLTNIIDTLPSTLWANEASEVTEATA